MPVNIAKAMVQLSTYPAPVQGIQHFEENVEMTVEDSGLGAGSLYVTESNVLWLNPSGEGIQLEYKLISLHAISRDLFAFPKEHLLLHYDAKIPTIEDSQAVSDSDEDEESETGLTQIRFAPQNSETLDTIFAAFSHCQTLHPDTDSQPSEDEEFEEADECGVYGINGMGGVHALGDGDGGFFTTEDGFSQLNDEGRANLERMNAMLAGQGDGLAARTTQQLHIANGQHNGNEDMMEQGQFDDDDVADN